MTMNISVRNLQGEEMLDALYALNMYSLHSSPPFQNKEEWAAIVRERKGVTCHAVFEDDSPVSVAVSTAMIQNMRGKLFPASGVWGVATHPSVRRKGYCKQTMASLLADERESGKAFSNLYPFRESFYERLGYISFPLTKIARLTPLSLSPLLKLDLDGEIELKLTGEAFETYREYLAEMRQSRHGMAFFDIGDKAAANRNSLWAALAKFDGKIEGLMLYRLQGEEVTKYNFMAMRFYYKTSRARYLLLNWIARHVDQADRVEIWLSEDEYPETWLADTQVKIESTIRPAMCRILDVEKIGGMNVGAGNFSARIIDPLCAWNDGSWHFESHDGKLHVSKTSKADCELTIQGFSAMIAGAYNLQDFPLRGWGNPDSALQSIQREIFPRMSPYLHEMF
jgi:predicted acetyltransferase